MTTPTQKKISVPCFMHHIVFHWSLSQKFQLMPCDAMCFTCSSSEWFFDTNKYLSWNMLNDIFWYDVICISIILVHGHVLYVLHYYAIETNVDTESSGNASEVITWVYSGNYSVASGKCYLSHYVCIPRSGDILWQFYDTPCIEFFACAMALVAWICTMFCACIRRVDDISVSDLC